jgi:polar amino acid transport system substrate-binding protein
MRKLISALLAGLLSLASPCTVATELRLGYPDVENFPLFMGVGPAVPPAPGIVVELVQRAVHDAGGESTIVRLAIARVYQQLKDGHIDGFPCLSYNEERAAYLAYPMRAGKPDSNRRCARLNYVIYQLHGGSARWDGNALSVAGPVGVNRAFSIVDRLRELGATVDEQISERELFAMLARGRVAAVVTLENIGDSEAARSVNAKRFEKLPLPLSTRDYFLGVTRFFYAANTPFVERVWTRIGELRDPVFMELTPRYAR